MQRVAGIWKFSHFGAPTVRHGQMPDPESEIKKHLAGTTIKIEEDGRMAIVAPGHASSGEVEIVEEASLYLKVGAKGRPKDEAYVYEKASDSLMLPSTLKVNGDTGVLPTYFKRSR